jgi:peptide subunit release factor RF-3
MIYPKFDRQDYLDGKLQPVFFGSALNNFGVRELLDCFVSIAPSPRPKESETRLVDLKRKRCQGLCLKSMLWTLNIESFGIYKIVSELLKETNLITMYV